MASLKEAPPCASTPNSLTHQTLKSGKKKLSPPKKRKMSHNLRKSAPTIDQTADTEFKKLPKIQEVIRSIELEIPEDLSIAGESISVIQAPKTPPKAKMGDPEFENLTSAEKLNDNKYRRLIYRTYPNEPTCKCDSERAKKYSNTPNCSGGCFKKSYSNVRKMSKNRNFRNISPNDFTGRRLRGGGEGFGNLENNYNLHRKQQFRLNEGGESNICSQSTNYNRASVQTNQKNCCCPDKAILDSVMRRRSEQSSIKKPCLGPECLIKAFEDAQEFVDSLGKIPGLPGLGLMDPGESPYFGRKYDDDYHDDDTATENSNNNVTPFPAPQRTNRHCTGVCNKKTENLPGRLSMIRESVPLSADLSNSVIPGPKMKKKDEKLEVKNVSSTKLIPEETGPCGDPKCRSKRKKVQIEGEETGILKGSKQKTNDNNNDSKDKDKVDFDSQPNKERNSRKPTLKVRPRIGKFIYSLGDSYPGVNCGHQNCKKQTDRVPPNMGWLWKEQVPPGKLKPRIGWKPGAINSRLRQVLQEVKGNFWPENKSNTSLSRVRKRLTTKKSRGFTSAKRKREKPGKTEEEWKEPPPTLQIQRKDGVYYVTMYPIKDDKMDIPKLEEPTKPLQFKIVKNRDDLSEVASSIASDMEIEFSPPAAVNRYRKMPDVIHVETQVKQQEIIDAYKPAGSKQIQKKTGKEKKSKK